MSPTEMAAALIEAADPAGVQTDSLAGIGVGSPGDTNEDTGDVSEARNLPGWEGSFPLGPTLADALGTEVRSATTSTSPPTPSSSSARGSPMARSSASSGARGSAAA